MIARIWKGRIPEQKADAYMVYLQETGLKDFRAVNGHRGAYVLRRMEGGVAEFLLISLWDSWDSIRSFAGPEPEKAVYYPEDENYLIELEPKVTHYDVHQAP